PQVETVDDGPCDRESLVMSSAPTDGRRTLRQVGQGTPDNFRACWPVVLAVAARRRRLGPGVVLLAPLDQPDGGLRERNLPGWALPLVAPAAGVQGRWGDGQAAVAPHVDRQPAVVPRVADDRTHWVDEVVMPSGIYTAGSGTGRQGQWAI